MRKQIILTSVIITLTGCGITYDRTDVGFGLAYQSKIIENADGSYTTEAEASPLRGRISGATKLAKKNARNHCAQLNKQMNVVKNEEDSNLLINGISRLTFKCQ